MIHKKGIARIRVFLLAAVLSLIFVPAAFADGSSPEALMEAGHWKQVRALAQKLAQQEPNNARSFYLMAEVKQAFGDDAGALPLAQKAIALDGTNAAYHLCLAEIYGDMAQHAGFFKQVGLARSFKTEADKAVSLDPKNLDAHFDLLQFYLDAPGIVGGGKDKAYAEATAIAQLNPARGYSAQAQIATHDKDMNKLLTSLKAAAQADPRRYENQIALANYYIADPHKNYDLAENYARAAIKLDAGQAGAYDVLVQVYANQQRWKELDSILSAGKHNDPDDCGFFYQAGRILLTQNQQLPQAEQYFRAYLSEEPEPDEPPVAAAHWRLAGVLAKEGRKPEAAAELQTALRLQPNFPQAKKDLQELR
ncbi:MAG: tetratricopeptide repeat protein [Candidatus Acidiferrales bacterium]